MAVVHLVLQAPEESLARGIVRRTALAAHGPLPLVLLHEAQPAGPLVVAALVEMDGRPGALGQRVPELDEHRVHELRVGTGTHRVGQYPAVIAVHDGREAGLAVREGELGDVGGQLRTGDIGWKSRSGRFGTTGLIPPI